MKTKISISLEKELHEKIKNTVHTASTFRNISHLIEHATKLYLENTKND